jgi:hypothetical protein
MTSSREAGKRGQQGKSPEVSSCMETLPNPKSFLLTLVIISIGALKLFNLMQSSFSIVLISEELGFYSKQSYLCLYLQGFSLGFPLVVSKCWSYIKVFDPFGIDFCTR